MLMDLNEKIEKILPLVEKPARYIGGEQGSIAKSHDGKCTFALAFPEIYELGASHFGGQIIYNIVNRQAELVCERVYMPWEDMRKVMRRKSIPLFSLETKTPIEEFDVLGFTLEHELSYTNILEMLDLAGIPIFCSQRTETDPLVIAGGTSAFHPEPLADFIDAFFIGDAEEKLIEILQFIKERKTTMSRKLLLKSLSQFQGVYVPSLYEVKYKDGQFAGFIPEKDVPYPVKAVTLPGLRDEFYAIPPIVPWVETVHNRIRIEINRGCGRGCRFCEAGFTYRPIRERTPESIFREAKQNFEITGWDEMGFLSLSATDHSALQDILLKLKKMCIEEKIKLSLPSIRIDQLSETAFEIVGSGRKTNLTFAPEAGTERLRRVINKPLVEDKLYESIEMAFKHNWRTIKIYFMIGLPTETDEDLLGIVRMLKDIDRIALSYRGKVRVTISPFIPKPHTPFQWEAQDSLAEIARKEDFIRSKIPRRIEFSARDPRISIIEGIISRGDRRLGKVIFHAWQNGAIDAAWKEFFKPALFFDAFADEGFSVVHFLRERTENEPLPWDVLSKGISREFLIAGRKRSRKGELLAPCWTRDCEKCPYGDFPPQKIVKSNSLHEKPDEHRINDTTVTYGRKPRREKHKETHFSASIVRIKYTHTGNIRFLGHLDILRLWERMIRVSKLPIVFTQGFHTHIKLSLSPPLPLGCESEAEYIDIFLDDEIYKDMFSTLQKALPPGIDIVEYKPFRIKPKALQAVVKAALWRSEIPLRYEKTKAVLDWAQEQNEIEYFRHIKKVNIRKHLLDWRISDETAVQNKELTTVEMLLNAGNSGSGRPSEYFAAYGIDSEIIAQGKFVRKELLIPRDDGWIDPMGNRVSR